MRANQLPAVDGRITCLLHSGRALPAATEARCCAFFRRPAPGAIKPADWVSGF